jgi:hypothetical protein
MGSSPVSYSRIRPFPCFPLIGPVTNEIILPGLDPFPLFPETGSNSAANPFVKSPDEVLCVSQSEIVYPSRAERIKPPETFVHADTPSLVCDYPDFFLESFD